MHAADFKNFEERHNVYMSSYKEYRELDEELNASWKILRSKCSKEQFKIELDEQRNWLKNREYLIEKAKSNRKNEKDATLKVIKDRIAYINYKIFRYDKGYINLNIEKISVLDKDFYVDINDGDDCYAIVASRPVLMANYISIVKNKSKDKWISQYIYGLISDDLYNKIKNGRVIIDGLENDFYPDDKGIFDYYDKFPEIERNHDTTYYTVEYENENFASISVWTSGNIGFHRDVSGPLKSIFIDKNKHKILNFNSLFEYPEIAKTLIKNIILLKLRAFENKNNDEVSEMTYDEINEWDFDYACIDKSYVILKPSTLRHLGFDQDYLFKVSLEELAVASPKKEYFTD